MLKSLRGEKKEKTPKKKMEWVDFCTLQDNRDLLTVFVFV